MKEQGEDERKKCRGKGTEDGTKKKGRKKNTMVSPVSQWGPVKPEGQTHVLGDTQVPPLLHPSSQKAENRIRKSH